MMHEQRRTVKVALQKIAVCDGELDTRPHVPPSFPARRFSPT